MIVETIMVYKGASAVKINKADLPEWNKNGYLTSSQRQKKSGKKSDRE